MAIRITERIVPLSEATKFVPPVRNGRRIHVSTLYRWADRGVQGVVLETCKVGGTRCTSVEAIERFIEALSKATPPSLPQKPNADSVEEQLARLGI
ncbi:DUF1580 domain-containing protein [bacterium]|nr:DUF1580 domain-containing protein [bacterium]